MYIRPDLLNPLNALKKLTAERQKRPLVAIPGHFLHWLGISPKLLVAAYRDKGIRCESFIGSAPKALPDLKPKDLRFPNALDESLLYYRCVLTDSLPGEYRAIREDQPCEGRRLLATHYAHCMSLFSKNLPQLVVTLQGFEPHNAAARAAAYRIGIPVLTLENTAVATRMIWDSISGITTNRNSARSFYWRYQDRVQGKESDDYCKKLIADTRQLKSDEHSSPQKRREICIDKPFVLFLGQVYTDSSIVFGLRHWSSPVEALQRCVEWCERQDYGLVVKLHPKEFSGINTIDNRPYDRLTYRKIQAIPSLVEGLRRIEAKIDEKNELDTYHLIDGCRIAVTINSQSGLEAAIRGKPVVCCGDAFYCGFDFTCDAPSPAYFSVAMEQANQTLSNAVAQKARQFAYIFFHHYCREKSVGSIVQLTQENGL
ncbi:MAG: hypothetical protein CMM01_11020 [Rhodopirellula sp.]|nr:hypothetical protein [Rhodopirellula sp.]